MGYQRECCLTLPANCSSYQINSWTNIGQISLQPFHIAPMRDWMDCLYSVLNRVKPIRFWLIDSEDYRHISLHLSRPVEVSLTSWSRFQVWTNPWSLNSLRIACVAWYPYNGLSYAPVLILLTYMSMLLAERSKFPPVCPYTPHRNFSTYLRNSSFVNSPILCRSFFQTNYIQRSIWNPSFLVILIMNDSTCAKVSENRNEKCSRANYSGLSTSTKSLINGWRGIEPSLTKNRSGWFLDKMRKGSHFC